MSGFTKVKLSLTCSNCSKIFKNPIELPCEHLVCKEHLMEMVKQNRIKCAECKQEFEVKGNELKSAEFVKKLINSQIYLSDEEIVLKKKIEDSIKFFFGIYELFTLNKNYLDSECQDHFQELKRQLDMHREKIKEKVDDIYMDMIEKTKEFEVSNLRSILSSASLIKNPQLKMN